MQIYKPGMVRVEIGPLIGVARLPMSSRIAHGMKTICDACRKPITDDFFIGGFISGHPNVKLHEACTPPESLRGVAREDGGTK